MNHVAHHVIALLLLSLFFLQSWAAEPQDAVGHAKVSEPSPISPAKIDRIRTIAEAAARLVFVYTS